MASDPDSRRNLITGLLATDAAIHLPGYLQADDGADEDRAAMAAGAATYTTLAAGVLLGNRPARRVARIFPAIGVAAVLTRWQRSSPPAPTRAAIIGVDAALVAIG